MDESSNIRTIYQELCHSYRAIDDFRAKLLGFLPLATGTGIFLLLSDKANADALATFLPAIGTFGCAITLGLFCYELYGIKKCTSLIKTGEALEKQLNIGQGQFKTRPLGVLGFINEPFAASIIYSAVLAAWTFLAFTTPHGATPTWPTLVYISAFIASFFLIRRETKAIQLSV